MFTTLLFSSLAQAVFCQRSKSAFAATAQLYNQVAIIGDDDREIRQPGDISSRMEAAQARLWCLDKSVRLPSGKIPTKAQLKGNFVSNATIAFEDDMAVVNRHMFLNDDGKPNHQLSRCYIEHIKSAQIIPLTDIEYPALGTGKMQGFHRDFAVVRLGRKLENGSALREEDILIDSSPDIKEQVTVVSNYGLNMKSGNVEALTMTNCHRYGLYTLDGGVQSNVFATDCDSGHGSSGAQAYLRRKDGPKWFGIVSGETKKVKEGGAFSGATLSTGITKFDETIFAIADKMRSRGPAVRRSGSL